MSPRAEIIQSVLRILSNLHSEDESAHAGWDLEYAEENLLEACRAYVREADLGAPDRYPARIDVFLSFAPGPIARTISVRDWPGVELNMDIDKDGKPVGLEILDVRAVTVNGRVVAGIDPDDLQVREVAE